VEINLRVDDGAIAAAQRNDQAIHDAVQAAVYRAKAEADERVEKARLEERQRACACVRFVLADGRDFRTPRLAEGARQQITDMILAPGSPPQWRVVPK
jgi:hypothetical protein